MPMNSLHYRVLFKMIEHIHVIILFSMKLRLVQFEEENCMVEAIGVVTTIPTMEHRMIFFFLKGLIF